MLLRKLLYCAVLTSTLFGIKALADEVLVGSEEPTWIQKHTTAYYLNWLTGMNTEAVSGNRDGTGTNLEDDHFFAGGYRFDSHTTLTLTYWAVQNLNETTASRDTSKQFDPQDPFLTLTQTSILHSDEYHASLDGYLRVYLPFSRSTSDALNSGTVTDYGRGMVRVYVSPSKTWFDRRLTFFGNIIANYYVPLLTPAQRFQRSTAQAAEDGSTTPASYRQNMYLALDPILDYSFSPKVDAYVEWWSGKIRHFTSGQYTDSTGTHPIDSRWSSIGDPSVGDLLNVGVNWAPTKKVFINPYLSYALSALNSTNPTKRRVSLFHCDLGLQMQYTFN
jgi:hypothetical protein